MYQLQTTSQMSVNAAASSVFQRLISGHHQVYNHTLKNVLPLLVERQVSCSILEQSIDANLLDWWECSVLYYAFYI